MKLALQLAACTVLAMAYGLAVAGVALLVEPVASWLVIVVVGVSAWLAALALVALDRR